MRKLLGRCLRQIELLLYRQKVKGALALHRRGEARRDGLALADVCNRLEIRWHARDIHPWDRDRDLPAYEREIAFVNQTLADTEAAIARLFERLPQVDIIEIGVLERTGESLIAEGVVRRSELMSARPGLLSTGMRLRELGMRYRFPATQRDDDDAVVTAGDLWAR